MKKLLAILLAVTVVAGFAACGVKNNTDVSSPAFKAGVWAVMENGEETGKTYTFTESKTGCYYDNGLTGLGFDYEIQGNDYVFHMGSADDNTVANVIFTDDDNCTVAWADRGVTDTLKYIGEADEAENAGDETTKAADAGEEGETPFGGVRPMIINSEPFVVTAKESFDNFGVTELYCDATASYSFTASDDDTTWKVFVLDKKFEDGARFLPQAEKPALEGNGTLEIAEGKYIYILCSESSFNADSASDASLSVDYAEAADSLSGHYQDSYSQRAVAEVTDNGETVAVTVYWSSSAFERTVWQMTCKKDGDKLSYTDCKKANVTTDDSGEGSEEVEYENGEGYFTLKDGKLLWDGAAEEDCTNCAFEK